MDWKRYALLGIATFGFYLWICRPLIAAYYPTTDEIAIEAASTPIGGPIHPSSWFTQGFQDYFHPYAEWESRPSNFFRPIFNALFWIYYQVFGAHWAYQLVFGYLVHALAVSLSAYLAIAVFGLTRSAATLSILIAALNPACWSLYPDTFAIPPVAQFPAYQTEIICGTLVLAAFMAFIRGRFALFALATTLALFLKETALTIPIAALALPGVWIAPDRSRSVRNFLWLATPLAAWLLIKLSVFEHGFSSFVMTSSKPLSWLTQPIRNTLLWPTGLYTSALGQTRSALQMHEWNIVSVHALELGINTAWWAAIALAVLHGIRRYGRCWSVAAPAPWVAALVFAGSNLALVVALQESHLRYGYLWFVLGPAPVLSVLSRRRGGIAMSAALGLGLALPQLYSIRNALSDDSVSDYVRVKQAARQLTSLLGSLPSGVSIAYLIDDMVVQIPTPKYMAKFSGYQGRLLLVNSIRPVPHCTASAQTAPRYRLIIRGDMTELAYSPPTCFEPYFGLPPLALIGPDNRVQRGPWMTYEFPQLSVGNRSATAGYGVGQAWSVSSRDPACLVKGACVWIGFDEHSGNYYQLGDATRVD
jgi:hypothetical protein